MPNSDLPEIVVWRIYHLMRGGIDESQPMRLAALAGVSAFDLGRINLANLFNYAHRKWGGLSWASPDEPVFENPPALPQRPLAKCGEQLVCDNCGRICAVIPCVTCEHGTPPKWISKRNRRKVLPQTAAAMRELLAEYRDPFAAAIDYQTQPRSSVVYHGNPQDDT